MSTDFDPVFLCQQNGAFGSSGVMPPVNTVQSGVVSALYAKFEPEFGPGAAGKKFHLLPIEAIGASAPTGTYKTGQSFKLVQQGIQPGGGAVGIGKGLKVTKEKPGMLEAVGLGEVASPVAPLLAQRTLDSGTGAEGIAEYAATAPQRAVPVGTARARVEGNFLNFFAIAGA